MKFWTNVSRHKGKILRRGVDEGTRVYDILTYSPYLFLQSNKPNTKYKTLYGKNVDRLNFKTIWDQKEWMDQHEDVEGFEFHGCQNQITSFIYDNYPGEVKFDPKLINIAIFDIELDRMISGDNFIEEALGAITTIALFINDQKYAFGVKAYDAPKDVKYFHCKDETVLLDTFLEIWENSNIDVISGYHCEGFDIPYLVNRIHNVLGYEAAERLSPFGIIKAKQVPDKFGRTKNTYDIVGCSILDYMELYKKFTLQVHGQLESYSLNFVAHFELSEKKIDYSQYEDLMELYEKDFQLFMDYNIHDVELIRRLDKKLKFFDLVFEMAYIAKCNYQDVLKTTPVWESLIHSYLMDRRIVLPPRKYQTSNFTIPGGYVKEPIPGLYRWIVSCDMTSLYPTIIMSYNISPETYKGKVTLPSIDEIVSGDRTHGLKFASSDVSVTAGGSTYRQDKEGFLPALMRDIFERRKTYKKMMLEAMEQNEKSSSPELEAEIDSLKAKQMAYKILANSGYGALANQYFLFFSHDLAMSITLTGQLTIKWVAKRINEYLNRILKTTNVDYVVAVDTDSVAGDTILYVNGEKRVIAEFYDFVEKIGTHIGSGDKLIVDVSTLDLKTSSFDGDRVVLDKIQYVMKHKVKKRMFRIEVDGKSIDVTEDHSLVVKRSNELISVKPMEIEDGDVFITALDTNQYREHTYNGTKPRRKAHPTV